MTVEFKLGPRTACKITATPPYTVEWQGQECVVDHTGDRLTITTRGLSVLVKSKGYTRVNTTKSETVDGSKFVTAAFVPDHPLEPSVKKIVESKPAVPSGPSLPAPPAEIAKALVETGYFDFYMPDSDVEKLLETNAIGKALSQFAVSVGRIDTGGWRVTLA